MNLVADSNAQSQNPAARRRFFLFAGALFLVIVVVYAINFSPALYYDDWDQFAYRFFTGSLPWFLKGFVRPLNFATYRLQVALFGFNLNAFMAYRIFLLALEGVLFFTILEKLKAFSTWLNLACALIILLSPQDMTRMWLLMDPIMVVVLQVYILLLIHTARKKSVAALVISLFLAVILLLNYEAPLGVILAFPVFLFLYRQQRFKENCWLLLAPFVLGLAYLGYRAAGPLFDVSGFHKSQQITPIYLLRQLRNGLFSFFQGWALPIQMDEVIRYSAVGALAIALGVYLVNVFLFGFERDNRRRLLHAAGLLCIGGLFWLAGYFPWIAYGLPARVHWFNTRAHIFAIPGSTVCLLAVLELLGGLVRVQPDRKALLSAALALPFLVVGIQSQIAIQWETKNLWQDYKAMWQGIFKAVPDLRNNPHVVLIIHPGVKDLRYGEHDFYTMASYNVEISCALGMFYGDKTLEGEFIYENMETPNTPTIHDNGIRNPPTYSVAIPYKDILFIRFDRVTKRVEVVRDLKFEFGVNDPTYRPERFISPRPMTRPSLRYIFN